MGEVDLMGSGTMKGLMCWSSLMSEFRRGSFGWFSDGIAMQSGLDPNS